MMLVVLQVPGGPELLVLGLIAFIFLMLVAVIVAIVVGIAYLGRRTPNRQPRDEQRIAELEQRVEELEENDKP